MPMISYMVNKDQQTNKPKANSYNMMESQCSQFKLFKSESHLVSIFFLVKLHSLIQ